MPLRYLFLNFQVPAARHGQPEEQVPEPEEVFLYMGIVDFLQVSARGQDS